VKRETKNELKSPHSTHRYREENHRNETIKPENQQCLLQPIALASWVLKTASSSRPALTWPPKLALRTATATATLASGAAPHDLEAYIGGCGGGRRPHGVRAPHSPAAIRTTGGGEIRLRSLLAAAGRAASLRLPIFGRRIAFADLQSARATRS